MKTETTPAKKIPLGCATTPLERNALRWLNERGRDYNNGAAGVYADLAHGGCQSGIVGHLIYSRDCRAFFQRHRGEINKLLAEQIEECGVNGPADLLREWDKSDPLGEDVNTDRLAWFGFETAARNVAQKAGIET